MRPEIERIAASLHELEDRLSACTRCGACLSACPVYLATGREADAARGKLALLEALADRMFEAPAGVMARLERCLMCGACARRCPVGVNTPEIFARARFILKETMGLSALQRIGLRRVLAMPQRCNRLLAVMAGAMNRVLPPQRKEEDLLRPKPGPLPLRPNHWVAPAAESFLDTMRRRGMPEPTRRIGTGPRVAFFVGCLPDKVFTNIAHRTLGALGQGASHLILPLDQGCCGMPAVSAGDLSTFSRLVRHHVNLFGRHSYDYLVTACATCTATIRTLWPTLCRQVSQTLAAEADRMAEKTLDVSQFLCHVAGIGQRPLPTATAPIPVTYHDPCHLKKSLGIFTEPRALIQANPRYRLVEMQDSDGCCGMGGSFGFHHAGISMQIGSPKRAHIAATGAAIVATTCPACMIQLRRLLAHAPPGVQVRHVIEL